MQQLLGPVDPRGWCSSDSRGREVLVVWMCGWYNDVATEVWELLFRLCTHVDNVCLTSSNRAVKRPVKGS